MNRNLKNIITSLFTLALATLALAACTRGFEALDSSSRSFGTGKPIALDAILNAWTVDINPRRPFGDPQGVIPVGAIGNAGNPNRAIAHVETVDDDKVVSFDLDKLSLEVQSTSVTWGKTRAPDYKFASPVLKTDFKALLRQMDELAPTRWVYKHHLNRHNTAAYSEESPEPDSTRSEVLATGKDRFSSWGSEEMVVGAIRLPAYWKTIEPTGTDWAIHLQWHDAGGGLTHNPPISLVWRGGGSDLTKAGWTVNVRKYALTPDEWLKNPVDGENEIVASAPIVNPDLGKWHYFVVHYVSGPGPYSDPVDGLIYGPTDPQKVFVRFYHAEGNGPLQKVLDYVGFWGSPHSFDSTSKLFPGYWKTGLYTHTNWTSGGEEREVFSQGFMQWNVSNAPGLTPDLALSAFKKSRE